MIIIKKKIYFCCYVVVVAAPGVLVIRLGGVFIIIIIIITIIIIIIIIIIQRLGAGQVRHLPEPGARRPHRLPAGSALCYIVYFYDIIGYYHDIIYII